MSFLDFARGRGLVLDDIRADGRVHRCRTTDHPRKRNGAYSFDGRSGWAQNWAVDAKAHVYRDGEAGGGDFAAIRKAKIQDEREKHQRASQQARAILQASAWAPHPYLASKGFPREPGLVRDGLLIVPMWDVDAYGRQLNSIQKITAAGEKKFLNEGKAGGSVYRVGSGFELWHCEGLATALSIRAALKWLHRTASVVVCFSAGNLERVARQLGGRVVADNDPDKVIQRGDRFVNVGHAGEIAAKATGLPWCMPPAPGMDANDYHRAHGVQALAEVLRTCL